MSDFPKQKVGINHSVRLIMLGFLVVILAGTFLLCLPGATKLPGETSFLDALFTATSAVCVTGLVVVDTATHWTTFGQMVILLLIQIGGIGFMTFITFGFMMAGKRITLKERLLIKESYNHVSIQGMVRYARNVLFGTLVLELIGAVILSIYFSKDYGMQDGIYYGVFHSISSFCNAGFDILEGDSLVPYVGNIGVNMTIMLLIIIGGLGFTVWMDTIKIIKLKKAMHLNIPGCIRRLSLHSKIVYTTTPILILGGMLFFFIVEFVNPDTMGALSVGNKLQASLFQSVTSRTAGFNSISQAGMTDASKFMTILLMVVGGSPGGTAGGIKTVTMAVILIAVLSVIKGSQETHVYERRIPFDILQKALAVFIISFTAIIIITMILTFTERSMLAQRTFLDMLFEVVSALGTVGVTTGVTPHLSTAGRLIIIFAMFIGRIGPITIVIGLTRKQNKNADYIHYPDDWVIVG